jgi:hypothetical protein
MLSSLLFCSGEIIQIIYYGTQQTLNIYSIILVSVLGFNILVYFFKFFKMYIFFNLSCQIYSLYLLVFLNQTNVVLITSIIISLINILLTIRSREYVSDINS